MRKTGKFIISAVTVLVMAFTILPFTGQTSFAAEPNPQAYAIPSVVTKVKVESTGVKKATVSFKLTKKSKKLTGVLFYYDGELKSKLTCNETATKKVNLTIPYKGKTEITIAPFYSPKGVTDPEEWFYGKASDSVYAESKAIGKASATATKISDDKVHFTLKKGKNATGTAILYYNGKKWIEKKLTRKISATIRMKNAAKYKYKVKAYIIDRFTGEKKIYRRLANKSFKAKSNVKAWSYPTALKKYKAMYHYFRPNKVYYKDGKAVLKCRFINRHGYTLKNIKVKVKITCQGKTVGTKVVNSGNMSGNTSKTKYVKLKTKTRGLDLRAGGTGWEHDIISAIDFEGEYVKN